MCINCRKAAIEDIAILGNAAVAAYNTNSDNEALLRALQRTLIEIEQLHADNELREIQRLANQDKTGGEVEGQKPDDPKSNNVPDEIREIIKILGGDPNTVVVTHFPKV